MAAEAHGGEQGRALSRRALLTTAGLAGTALALRHAGLGAARPAPNSARRAGASLGAGGSVPRAGGPAAPVRRQPPGGPEFSAVEQVEPWDVLMFLAGKHPRYPGASLDNIIAFSAANILETTDTDVMDAVMENHGESGAATVYGIIARNLLDALLAVYGDAWVLLGLDAGHGGNPDVYFDPGSRSTEWSHAREVVKALEALASDPRYRGIIVRRIFNDEIGDDFLLPPPDDRKSAASLTIRNGRAAMLAYEVDAWNRTYPDSPVVLHVLSIHFNADSGGILAMFQGDTVPEIFREHSLAYARAYVEATRPALNATGLLPYPLRLALGSGISDDRLLYEDTFSTAVNPYTGVDGAQLPHRYALLQTSLAQRDFADGALRYHKLV